MANESIKSNQFCCLALQMTSTNNHKINFFASFVIKELSGNIFFYLSFFVSLAVALSYTLILYQTVIGAVLSFLEMYEN